MGRAGYRILGSINGLSSTRRNVSMPIVSNSDISIRGRDPIAPSTDQAPLKKGDEPGVILRRVRLSRHFWNGRRLLHGFGQLEDHRMLLRCHQGTK